MPKTNLDEIIERENKKSNKERFADILYPFVTSSEQLDSLSTYLAQNFSAFQRHGHWIYLAGEGLYVCSHCGVTTKNNWDRYCRECGYRMHKTKAECVREIRKKYEKEESKEKEKREEGKK